MLKTAEKSAVFFNICGFLAALSLSGVPPYADENEITSSASEASQPSVSLKLFGGLISSAQNKSHGIGAYRVRLRLKFCIANVENRREIGGFLQYMWLFSRAFALWRTPVRRRQSRHGYNKTCNLSQ